MAEKNFKARIVHKHDLESNWLKSALIPKQGEIVVYDVEIDAEGNTLTLPDGRTEAYTYERFKIGDGIKNVNDLLFADDALKDSLEIEIGAVDDKIDAVSALVGDTSVSDQISTAIASSQADWNQNDETASDYIKNRLVYKKPAYPYPEDPVSVPNAETMYCIWDWTNETYKTTYQHAFTLSKVKDSYAHDDADYGSSRLELSLSNDGTTWNPWYFTWMDVYPAVCYSQMLDTKNYLMWEYGNIIYVILDLTTLTSEYASKFTNIGIFYYREANAAMPFTSVKVEFPNYSALSAKYIPKSIARTYQLDEVKEEVSELGLLIGDTSVSEQINTALQESVADWNQTDETAADYIKNKTHYDSRSIVEGAISWEHSYDTPLEQDGTEKIADAPIDLESLKKLSIISTYTAGTDDAGNQIIETWEFQSESNTIVDTSSDAGLSDGSLVGITYYNDDTDCLLIYVATDEAAAMLGAPSSGLFMETYSGDISYNVSIDVATGELKTLDLKYLPNSIQADWTQTDETQLDYVKNRTHYEEVTQESIEGVELSWNIGQDHDTIPFELGQIWDFYLYNNRSGNWINWNYSGANDEGHYPVQQATDGTFYIGDPNVNAIPFYITTTSSALNGSFENMNYATKLKIVCVSGTKTVTKVKTLDEKYIPDTIARVDTINDLNTLIGDTSVADQISTALESSKADWDQTNETAFDYIKNKPEIATDADTLDFLSEMSYVTPVANADGSIYANEQGQVYTI